MALINDTDPVSCTLTFVDNNNNVATMSFFTNPTLTFAATLGKVNGVRDAVVPLTNARLAGGTITFALTEDAPGVAVPESEVERKLVLVGRTASRRQKPRFFIPSPIFSLESPGTDAVALNNPLVAALISELAEGGITPGNGAVAVSGLDIIGIDKAYFKHYTRQTTA